MVEARRVVARYLSSPLSSLADVPDERYGQGDTTIWYFKPSERLLMMGNSYIRENHPQRLPEPTNLEATHIKVGQLDEEDNSEVLRMMQALQWSPRGEATSFIQNLGLDHVSMVTGDVIQRGHRVWMVDSLGWFENLWLMTIDDLYQRGFRNLTKAGWEPYAHIELMTLEGERAPFAKFHEYVQMRDGTDPKMISLDHPFDFGYPIWEPWYHPDN